MLFALGIGLIGSSIGAAGMYAYIIKSYKVVSKDRYMQGLRELNTVIEVYRELKEGEN